MAEPLTATAWFNASSHRRALMLGDLTEKLQLLDQQRLRSADRVVNIRLQMNYIMPNVVAGHIAAAQFPFVAPSSPDYSKRLEMTEYAMSEALSHIKASGSNAASGLATAQTMLGKVSTSLKFTQMAAQIALGSGVSKDERWLHNRWCTTFACRLKLKFNAVLKMQGAGWYEDNGIPDEQNPYKKSYQEIALRRLDPAFKALGFVASGLNVGFSFASLAFTGGKCASAAACVEQYASLSQGTLQFLKGLPDNLDNLDKLGTEYGSVLYSETKTFMDNVAAETKTLMYNVGAEAAKRLNLPDATKYFTDAAWDDSDFDIDDIVGESLEAEKAAVVGEVFSNIFSHTVRRHSAAHCPGTQSGTPTEMLLSASLTATVFRWKLWAMLLA